MARDLDCVVFGATGDTGLIGSALLYFQSKKLGITSWAPAARNLEKLKKDVLDRLPSDAGPDGVKYSEPIQADSGDYEALLKMAKRTKLVIACAGPFGLYGEGVVKACVEAGTHYVDITGEVPWVEKMERKYGEEAEKKGIFLVSMAGYDSVPPDLTTWLAAKALKDAGCGVGRVTAFVGGGGGAMPSGTIDTMCEGISAAKRTWLRIATLGMLGQTTKKAIKSDNDSAVARSTKPYVPKSEQANLFWNNIWTMLPGYSINTNCFVIPHFMAPININVVHRTAALEGYGGLLYRERMGTPWPSGPLSLYGLVPLLCVLSCLPFFGLFVCLPYATKMILKFRDTVNPALRDAVRKAIFNKFSPTGATTCRTLGRSKDGKTTALVELKSQYDSGLGFTMLSACTVASQLLKKQKASKEKAGFHTAVTGVGGQNLADALTAMGCELKVTTTKE